MKRALRFFGPPLLLGKLTETVRDLYGGDMALYLEMPMLYRSATVESLTYRELHDFTVRFAGVLAAKGVTPGQRVEIKIKAQVEDILKSAADLQHKTFEELRWIVPKYVPEGSALMAGRPKIGKSWLGLDAGVAVSSGGTCLGQQCEQGDVLALMLEDSDRRLQRRLTRMLGAQKDKWPESLTYATAWPRLNEGGLDWMRRWIDKASKPRLIIIDILERIRQRAKQNDKQSQYSADYAALVTLQELSTEAQLSVLALTHQRKLGAEDLIDTVSGTLGLGGAVDSIIILGNDTQSGKFLYGRGRDLEEFNVSIKQDENCRWQVTGPNRRDKCHQNVGKSSQSWHA